MSSSQTDLLESTIERIFVEHATPPGADQSALDLKIWQTLCEAGMAWLGVDESNGGSGGELDDASLLVRLVGRHAVRLPVAESTLLGGWLVEKGGLALPDGPVTVPVPRSRDLAVTIEGDRLFGSATWIPWGATASAIAILCASGDGDRVALVDPQAVETRRGFNLAGEARDAIFFDGARVSRENCSEPVDGLREELYLRGALSRALLMSGALESISAMTSSYAKGRRQFGRPIIGFQAVGNRLAQLSSEAEVGSLAAMVAASRFALLGPAAALDVAAAKATAARAASVVAAHAHQVHGAIGMTEEYPLHRLTRRLWAWRQEWGSESLWQRDLGAKVGQLGSTGLWPRLTQGLPA